MKNAPLLKIYVFYVVYRNTKLGVCQMLLSNFMYINAFLLHAYNFDKKIIIIMLFWIEF